MAELSRFRGGPGSGKTTQLISFISDELGKGVSFDDISIMTFSRSQTEDLKTRLRNDMPDLSPEQIDKRVATIDATVYRQCRYTGLFTSDQNPILQPGDSKRNGVFQEFMDQHQLDYNPKGWLTDTDDHRRLADIPVGNQLITLNSYLSSTLRSHNSWHESASSLGLTLSGDAYNIPELLSAWSEHKIQKEVVEHSDYVRLALDHEILPPASILIIDEYQDVSPLQHALLKHWIAHPDTKRAFVAGDEDQAIYAFRGCDPNLFLSLDAKDVGSDGMENRPESHRCPVAIMNVAERVLGKQSNVSAHTRWKGRAAHQKCPHAHDLIELVEAGIKHLHGNSMPENLSKKMFILSRFNDNAKKIARTLAKHGIPCMGIKESRNKVWTATIAGKRIDLNELKCVIQKYLTPGSEVDYDEAITFVHSLSGIDGIRYHDIIAELTSLDKHTILRAEHLHQITRGRKDDILDRLNLTQKQIDQIRACLHRDARRGFTIPPDMIQIDTIHASKGLESPITLLHSGYLKNRYSDLVIPERNAEERRVFFTAVTRTSKNLVIVDYGKSPVCPLLEEVI
ncbi:UvrD-helicase domain-containing protein [Methanocalculus sp. MC3]